MEEYNCSVVCDYLTNPYILPNPAITMSLARSASAAGKISLPQSYCCDTRCRHRFVENLMKQSLSRRSSFSFGSKIRRPETFSFRNIFKPKSSSGYSDSSSISTVSSMSCQSNQSTEEFWNKYRRHHPKLSLTLRAKQMMVVKPVSPVLTPPTTPHSSISL